MYKGMYMCGPRDPVAWKCNEVPLEYSGTPRSASSCEYSEYHLRDAEEARRRLEHRGLDAVDRRARHRLHGVPGEYQEYPCEYPSYPCEYSRDRPCR